MKLFLKCQHNIIIYDNSIKIFNTILAFIINPLTAGAAFHFLLTQ